MTVARGYKAATVIDFESVYNTTPSAKKGFKLPINKNELENKQTLIDSETITGTRNTVQSSLGRKSVDGNITIPADYRAIGAWLKALFGNPVNAGTAAPYTHKYKIGDTQPSFLVEKAFPDTGKYIVYSGCKINTAQFSFGEDNEMTVELAVMGAARTISGTAYNAAAAELKKLPISQNHTYVKIGGTESKIVKTGDFTLDAGLDGDQYVVGGGGVRGDIPEGLFKATGNITALFTDTSMMEAADTGTTTSLEIGFKLDTNTQLVFLFPEVQIEPHDAPISGPAGVNVSFAWRAFYGSNAEKSLVQVTLINDTKEY
nr:MAG TPA: Tail tube protein [Caudoviricetes sp.]DAX98278.1 MAG TPA: Tail tube protein [Caudoviricetes sp.]